MTCIPVCVLSLITSGLCVIADGGAGDRGERWSERKWRWAGIKVRGEIWAGGWGGNERVRHVRDMEVKRQLDFDYKKKKNRMWEENEEV